MPGQFACPHCGIPFAFAEAPLPRNFRCPHCRTDVQFPMPVQMEEPPATFRMDAPRIGNADIRRKTDSTRVLLAAMAVLVFFGILISLFAGTERVRFIGIVLVLVAGQLFLFLISRALIRGLWDCTGWEGLFRSLAFGGVVLILVIVSILVFGITVCAIGSP